jgi:hypothetical protein
LNRQLFFDSAGLESGFVSSKLRHLLRQLPCQSGKIRKIGGNADKSVHFTTQKRRMDVRKRLEIKRCGAFWGRSVGKTPLCGAI